MSFFPRRIRFCFQSGDKNHFCSNECYSYLEGKNKNISKLITKKSDLTGAKLNNARIVRQPADGNCFFHALVASLGQTAKWWRSRLCSLIVENTNSLVADKTVREWIKYETGKSVSQYLKYISKSGIYVGGIDMALLSMKDEIIFHVYDQHMLLFATFDNLSQSRSGKEVHLLFTKGNHYDLLIPPPTLPSTGKKY